jgi:hypothetical protein
MSVSTGRQKFFTLDWKARNNRFILHKGNTAKGLYAKIDLRWIEERPGWFWLWRLRLGRTAGEIVCQASFLQVRRRDHLVHMAVPVTVEV